MSSLLQAFCAKFLQLSFWKLGLKNVDSLRTLKVVDLILKCWYCISTHTILNVPHCRETSDGADSDTEAEYDVDNEEYRPIKDVGNDHNIMIVGSKLTKIPHQQLQMMHHGTTAIRWDSNSNHNAICHLRLENENGTLSWGRPDWSALRGSTNGPPDYVLKGEPDLKMTPGLSAKYQSKLPLIEDVEEGYIDLSFVKEVTLGSTSGDFTLVARRHNLGDLTRNNCLTLLYGSNISENRYLEFVLPTNLSTLWYSGLQKLVQGVTIQRRSITDRRMLWLKEQYLQLYFESDKCQGPIPAEAIRVSPLTLRNNTTQCKLIITVPSSL